jgi:hypothetical protein
VRPKAYITADPSKRTRGKPLSREPADTVGHVVKSRRDTNKPARVFPLEGHSTPGREGGRNMKM